MSDSRTLRFAAIGIAAGFLSGLLGVGGGVIIVPLLVLWIGWDQKRSQATSLSAVFFIAIWAATAFAIEGHVIVSKAILIGIPALVGVIAGTRIAARLAADTLGLMFAAFQITIAVLLFAR